jgi:predicted CXXCH cytochrome family protein
VDVLLREHARGSGTEEYRDTEFRGDRLVVGSAADAGIQILGERVSARHAELIQDGAQLRLRCGRRLLVRVNGVEVSSARLQVGDVIEIGGNRLRTVAAPAGFQFAIEITPDPDVDAGQFEAAFRTSLDQAWVSKRLLSWGAICVVVILGLVVPLVMAKHRAVPKPGEIVPQGMLAAAFSDERWSTGPLTQFHAQATGNQCKVCHTSLFERVRDDECKACHQNVADHVHPDVAAMAGAGAPVAQGRCASCHREHGESQASLLPPSETLCTSCHADPGQRFATLKMPTVSGFDEKSHPPFSPRMLVPDDVDATGWVIHKVPLANAVDQSHLKFSHQQHLDGKLVIRSQDNGPLQCADCHRPAFGGARFEPVTMREACSSCHELTFDPSEPRRQLPHGKPRDVILVLQEYFARRYFDPAAAPPVRMKRRVPGHSDEVLTCTAGALQCARQFAATEIEAQFGERGCVSCHEVVDTRAADILDRFEVRPVKLSDSYFPSALFDHSVHRIQKDLTGDAACLSCHQVKQSKSSQDVLLPDLPKCAQCHSTRPGHEQIETPCFTCHVNHPKGEGMRRVVSRPESP